MLERTLLTHYAQATTNNLNNIRKLLSEHPEMLDRRCPVLNRDHTSNLLKTTGKICGSFSLMAALALTVPPLAALFAVSEIVTLGYVYYTDELKCKRSRMHWTLLDYAAETGALSVAAYLIIKGADTSNPFYLNLAKENGHETFYQVCTMLSKVGDELKQSRAAIAALRCNVAELKDNVKLHDQSTKELQALNAAALAEIHLHLVEIKRLEVQVKEWEALYAESDEVMVNTQSNSNQAIPKTSSQGLYSPNNKAFPFGLTDKKIPYVPGDCFFDAVIANASQKYDKKTLRTGIYSTLQKNRDDNDGHIDHDKNLLISFLNNKTAEYETIEIPCLNYQQYCEHILNAGAWVDNIEIKAMCTAFKVCCVVAYKEADITPHVFGAEFAGKDNPPIIIGYVNANHYVALQCPAALTPMAILEKVQRANAATKDLKPC